MAAKKKPKAKTKSGGKAKKNKPANGAGASANGSIQVRMYKVGFGDCFLVRLTTGGRTRKILVDCGSVAKLDLTMKEIVDRVIDDVTDDGVAHIDVVVATHRHRDHVSGFNSPAWANVSVGEVWMPWTEHPTDPRAKKIRDIQSKTAMALVSRFAAVGADAIARDIKRAREEDDEDTTTVLAGIADGPKEITDPLARAAHASLGLIGLNAMSNEKAMKTLHEGFNGGGAPRFFLPEEKADGRTRSFTIDLLPGVKIHLLGPTRSEEVIRDMDPPDGESYLRMTAREARDEASPAPFHDRYRSTSKDRGPRLSADEIKDIENLWSEEAAYIMTSLDKAVNGTSLMFMLEIGETVLFFPGDAQWGTWQAALNDPEWKPLFKRTKFLKVGHHGSHNATPKDFVEDHLSGHGTHRYAMVSTKAGVYSNVPKGPLLNALSDGPAHAHVVRSDKASNDNAFVDEKHWIDLILP